MENRCDVPKLCGMICIPPAVVAVMVLSTSKGVALRPSSLWLSCWRSVHPLWLLVFRGFAALCMSWFLYRMVLLDGLVAFYFYSQWTLTLFIMYFVIGACISAHGCWIYSKYHPPDNEEANGLLERNVEENGSIILTYRTKQNRNMTKLQKYLEQEDKDQRAGFWGYAMQVIYQTSAGAVVLTDFIFWMILVSASLDKQVRVSPLTASMHIVNAIFLLLETLLNSMRFPLFRMWYLILWSSAYVAFQWILHARGSSWWPYSFLVLDSEASVVWYPLTVGIHICCYSVYFIGAELKTSYFPELLRSD